MFKYTTNSTIVLVYVFYTKSSEKNDHGYTYIGGPILQT